MVICTQCTGEEIWKRREEESSFPSTAVAASAATALLFLGRHCSGVIFVMTAERSGECSSSSSSCKTEMLKCWLAMALAKLQHLSAHELACVHAHVPAFEFVRIRVCLASRFPDVDMYTCMADRSIAIACGDVIINSNSCNCGTGAAHICMHHVPGTSSTAVPAASLRWSRLGTSRGCRSRVTVVSLSGSP